MNGFWPGFVTGFIVCAACVATVGAFAFTGDNTPSEVSPEARAEMAEMQGQHARYSR